MVTTPDGTRDAVRLFDLRHNWQALTVRPPFHDPVVDGVRALAILWVMSYHLVLFHLGSFTTEAIAVATGPWTQWTSRGDMGVDLFFVISGYLIGTILLGEYRKTGGIRITRFYIRRFLRLIPVYTVAMIVGLYFVHNIPREAVLMEFPPFMNADNMWANLLYVNNFLPVNRQYMGWCWSLAIEEQFYLILPGFLLIVMRVAKPLRVLGGLLLVAGIIRWFVIDRHGFVPPFLDLPNMQSWVDRFSIEYDNLYTRYGALLSGVIGAYLMIYHRDRVARFFARGPMVTFLAAAALIIIVPTAYFAMSSPLFNAIPVAGRKLYYSHHRDVFAVCVMFLILAAIHSAGSIGVALRRLLSWQVLYPIAQVSYSLYLVHEMFMLWLFPKTARLFGPALGAHGTMAFAAAIAIVMSFAGAALLYLFVEQPSMRARALPRVRALTDAGALTIEPAAR
ncbi:MAG TPA: acyltransferase [Vicinamibacterales bacterium]|nr:acyltransferase [Vicinamibacterales bacterium]